MKTKLINFWIYLKATFWFVPALIILLAIIFAFNLVTIDRILGSMSLRFYGFHIPSVQKEHRLFYKRIAIHRQANMILRVSESTLPEEKDRQDVRQRY